jgi:hypothetical protein
LTSEDFDTVGAEIARALDYFKVPKRKKQELFAVIVSKKAEVINPLRLDLHCCRPTRHGVP